jgi:hypothetical protein
MIAVAVFEESNKETGTVCILWQVKQKFALSINLRNAL